MEKKQSSIDKFVQQLKRKGLLITEDSEYIVAYLEAKAMHKAEIVKSSAQGYLMGVDEGFPLETAYNYAQQWYANQFEGGKK